jgi:hypothetical protein
MLIKTVPFLNFFDNCLLLKGNGVILKTALSSASLAPDIKLQAHVVNDCFEYRIKTDSDYSHHFLQSQMDLMNTNHAK